MIMCLISLASGFGKRLAGEALGLADFLVEHRDAEDHVAEQLAFVGVGDVAVVGELVDLGGVVEKRADEELVLIELRIARRDDEDQFHQADDVLDEAAAIGVMVFHAGRGRR